MKRGRERGRKRDERGGESGEREIERGGGSERIKW